MFLTTDEMFIAADALGADEDADEGFDCAIIFGLVISQKRWVGRLCSDGCDERIRTEYRVPLALRRLDVRVWR